jgi:hypothetical protein
MIEAIQITIYFAVAMGLIGIVTLIVERKK